VTTERLDIVISERGGAAAAATMGGVAAAAGGLSTVLMQLRGAIVGMAAAFAGRAMVGTWRDFGAVMATVNGILRTTADQARELREQAHHLGATTRFTASQVGESQLFLARAGFSVDQIIAAVPGTLDLATAGALDLGRAADIVSNVLTAFRGEVSQLPHFLNVMALAANTANTDIEMLGQGMKFVAPVAAGLGVSLEQTTAAMMALSDAGLQSSMSGTGLRQVLSKLEAPNRQARRIFEQLGVDWERLRPSRWAEEGLELADVLEILGEAGLGTGHALTIFGQRGGPAFEAMASQTEKIRGHTAALGENETAMTDLVATMNDTLFGDLAGLESAIEGMVLAIGDLGGEALMRGVVQRLTAGFRSLTGILQEIWPLLQAIAVGILAWATITYVPMALALAMNVLKGAVVGLFRIIMAHPLVALATAIAAVGFKLFEMRNQIAVTQDGVVTLGDAGGVVWDDLKQGAGEMATEVVSFFHQMFEGSDETFANIEERGAAAWTWIKDKLLDMVKAVVRTFFALRAQVALLWDDLKGLIEGRGMDLGTLGTRLAAAWQEGTARGEAYVEGFIERARERAAANRERERAAAVYGYNTIDPAEMEDPAGATEITRLDILARVRRELDDQLVLTRMLNRERQIEQQVRDLNNELIENGFLPLAAEEEAAYRAVIEQVRTQTEAIKFLDEAYDAATQTAVNAIGRMQALEQLIAQGGPLVSQYQRQLREARIEMLQFRIDSGRGTMADGFLLELERMLVGVEAFRARAGQAFGTFFSSFTDGFANSVGRAIVMGEDLEVTLQNVARNALAELISALIKLGIQWLLNATLGQSLAAAATAAQVAEAAVVASAWAPAAAAVSLASYGANAIPAMTGMTAAFGLAELLAASGAGLKDGGYVSGPGGPRADRIPAALSNGEFVVNAAATARNRAMLEAMNAGRSVGGGISINMPITVNGEGGKQAGAEIARQVELAVIPVLKKHMRPGGVLAQGAR
jgi:TP901 family phage tail tape measure protein